MRRLATAAVAAVYFATSLVAAERTERRHIPPGVSCIFTQGNVGFLVFAPVDGGAPIVVATFTYGGGVIPPDPQPTPSKVTAIWIIENQEDRTAAEAKILDDPVWQAAAIVKGLTYRIEDRDHPEATPFLGSIEIPLPVVCTVDGDGKLVAVVPLPAAVEGMRDLIGGVK